MSYVIYGLPRSRTAWLSRFLTYGDWHCGHEELRHARSMADITAWLSQPNTGTIETAGAPFWRLARDVKTVVIRRPVAEVVESLMALGLFADRALMAEAMRRLDAKLDQIEARVPGVLSVRFADLDDEATCKRVFEHCLPYAHDPAWWSLVSGQNIQISLPALMRYYQAYKASVGKLAEAAKQQILAKMHTGRGFSQDGVTISEEPFDAYFPGALDRIREHAIAIGEGAEYPNSMNFEAMRDLANAGRLQTVVARSNGNVFGYVLTVIQPCFVDTRIHSAAHHTTLWASEEFPGLGMKMVRAANDILWAKGAGEIIFRAGLRGDGPRLSTMYRRLGAEDCGRLYRLERQENAA